MGTVLTGLDLLREESRIRTEGYRLGLISNQSSLDRALIPAKSVVDRAFPGQLKALFGPQHGLGGIDQDNMIETDHAYDPVLKIPVFSLYSQVREPTPEMLGLIDLLLVDLQDVGTRVYTFASTVLACINAAAKSGKKVLILDRPNPLGGKNVEGNLLVPDLYSFVGPFRFPMRHGLTMGEMALVFNEVYHLGCDLEVLRMRGWTRDMIWPDTSLRWVMPSPNMPLYETTQVYPGQVIWEGTNISEGRGTCRPFEVFGAPFFDTREILKNVDAGSLSGCVLQEISFRPTFNKWKDEVCWGFMLHITDFREFYPYFTTLSLLKAILTAYPQHFCWKKPPYEYEYRKLPIDLILGDEGVRKALEGGASLFPMKARWDAELKGFLEWRKPYLLYL
jgi:uncharacterized protein YbbC (DUF1343 family)